MKDLAPPVSVKIHVETGNACEIRIPAYINSNDAVIGNDVAKLLLVTVRQRLVSVHLSPHVSKSVNQESARTATCIKDTICVGITVRQSCIDAQLTKSYTKLTRLLGVKY